MARSGSTPDRATGAGEPTSGLGRPIQVRAGAALAVALGLSLLAGCGDPAPAARHRAGIVGRVHVGPTCPVESAAHPCADRAAVGATVTVTRRAPVSSADGGGIVARTTTDAHGGYRTAVRPGTYVVTADAGMSCSRTRVRVAPGRFTRSDLTCDTGIR